MGQGAERHPRPARKNIITAAKIVGKDAGDSPSSGRWWQPRRKTHHQGRRRQGVPHRENMGLVEKVGGTAFVPFKSNGAAGGGHLGEDLPLLPVPPVEFLRHYHQRSNAESTFRMVKEKFRDHVRSKTDTAMKNEVL